MASKSSRAGVLYICYCSRCKGSQAFSYSTVSRHEDVYGKPMETTSGTFEGVSHSSHDDAMASDQWLPSESIDRSEANLEGQFYC